MGSRKLRGVRFQSYSGDHAEATMPHVHAHFDEGDVAIEIYADGCIGLSTQHGKDGAVDPGVKKPQVKRALKIAAAEVPALLALWEESRSR